MSKNILNKIKQGKTQLNGSISKFKNFKFIHELKKALKSILPSRKVLLLALFFYFFGIFLAAGGSSTIQFNFGFLTGNLAVQFSYMSPITWEYLKFQFWNYLGSVAGNIFLANMQLVLLCIFTGIIIIPIILVGLISFSGALAYTLTIDMGLKGVILYLCQFHLHLEVLGALLAIDGFIVFYFSILRSLWQSSLQPFKQSFKEEFLPLILKIILILALASLIEVFWSTWVVYIFTHPYISWTEFYLYLQSCVVV